MSVVILVSLHVAASDVRAQISPSGQTQQILGSVGFISGASDIAYDPQHDVYLVVAGYERLWGIFVDSLGNPVGPRFSIRPNDNAGHFAETPRISYSPDVADGAGGFLVTWIHRETAASPRAVRARIVAYPDRLVGSEGVVWEGFTSSHGAYEPHVAYSRTSRQFMAVWYVFGLTSASSGVHARPIGLDAQPSGPALHLDEGFAGDVVWHPATNEFAVVYRSGIVGGIVARFARLSVRGEVLRDSIVGLARMPPFSLDISDPALALNPVTGNFVMIWWIVDTAAAFEEHRFFSAEIDRRGDTIATGFIGTLAVRGGPSLTFNSGSRTFLLLGHCYPPVQPDEVCALHLNEHGERISQQTRVTTSGEPYSTGGSPPRAASGTGAAWLVVLTKFETYAQSVTTTATNGGPPGPPLTDLCQTPDPFQTLGGGLCVYGGWVPRTHPLARRGSPLVVPPASCVPPDPFVVLGGGVCVNGGWVPKDHPLANPRPAPLSPGACATPDPFTAMGGGVCINGGWRPRS